MSDVKDLFDAQIASQGVGVVSVKNGIMLMLTKDILEQFLERASKNPDGRVVVFIKHQIPA